MNEKINVIFLNKEYALPYDIVTYVNEHHFFESMRQDMLKFMLNNFADPDNFPDESEKVYDDKIKALANICVTKVLEHGIYNVTIDDFTHNNLGIPMFDSAWRAEAVERIDAKIEQVTNFMQGAQNADSVRKSQITGTGLTIITNSIVGFGVWAALESSEINKQSANADIQYRNTVTKIESEGILKEQRRIANYRANVYLPQIKECADTTVISFFKKYINILIDNNQFDKSALRYNHSERADSILQNVNKVYDSTDILQAAFEQCPYYYPIYITAIEQGKGLDLIIEAAKTFCNLDVLCEYIYLKCQKLTADKCKDEKTIIKDINPFLSVLSNLKGTSFDEEINILLSQRRTETIQKIKEISSMKYNTSEFDAFVRKLLPKESIVSVECDLLKEKLINYINESILQNDDSSYYNKEKIETVEALSREMNLYREEAKKRFSHYKQLEIDFEKLQKDSEMEISTCESELQKLGLFSISKKSSLRNHINEIRRQLQEKKHSVESAYNEFEKMFKNN